MRKRFKIWRAYATYSAVTDNSEMTLNAYFVI